MVTRRYLKNVVEAVGIEPAVVLDISISYESMLAKCCQFFISIDAVERL